MGREGTVLRYWAPNISFEMSSKTAKISFFELANGGESQFEDSSILISDVGGGIQIMTYELCDTNRSVFLVFY